MAPTPRSLAASVALLTVAACGGGGGGGGTQRAEVAFTSFSSVRANQTVVMQGDHRTQPGTVFSGTTTVNSFGLESTGTDVAQLRLSYDSSRALDSVRINTPGTSLTFSRTTDTFVCSSGVCGLANDTALAFVMDPVGGFVLGWNYQTFGVWNQSTSATSFRAGALTVGSRTPDLSIPTTGVGTFSGIAHGFYVRGDGASFSTTATMSATADFVTRNITFSTGTPTLVALTGGGQSVGTGLAMSGTLSYAVPNQQPRFSGDVTTTSGLTGRAGGYFYGPNAQEIGGTYSLTGAGGPGSIVDQKMIGAFGGRQ